VRRGAGSPISSLLAAAQLTFTVRTCVGARGAKLHLMRGRKAVDRLDAVARSTLRTDPVVLGVWRNERQRPAGDALLAVGSCVPTRLLRCFMRRGYTDRPYRGKLTVKRAEVVVWDCLRGAGTRWRLGYTDLCSSAGGSQIHVRCTGERGERAKRGLR